MIALLASRSSTRKPILLTVRGSDLQLTERKWIEAISLYTLKRVDKISTVDQALKHRLIEMGIAEVDVLPNGVDSDRFRPVDAATARRELGLPADNKVVLFVGMLIPIKGIEYLLEAIRVVAHKDENAIFAFVGEGHLKSKIVERLEDLADRVVIAGSRPSTETPLWMNAADILVLPSLSEGRPNVVLEAMACGTSVVATPVGGIPQLLQDGKTGLLVPTRDSEALARSLLRLLRNEDLREELARQARDTILSKGLTWERTADRFAELYRKLSSVPA
jgi:glycosyltransferase involved in cell wall biosynthesis